MFSEDVWATHEPTCRCGYRESEHDPINLRCPDDEDEARANREEASCVSTQAAS